MNPRGRALIIDDDDSVRETVSTVLHDLQLQTDLFDQGSRALEYLEGGPRPDVIFLDLLLRSDLNGWQVAEMLRDDPRYSDIPIVAITGAHLDTAAVKQLRTQAILRKPLELTELEAVVDRFVPRGET